MKWVGRKTNEWVLQQAGEEQQLLKKIRKRRQKWIGHVLCHEGLVKIRKGD